ncbi:hypothetical protein QFZ68_000173 [Streptomyces sp. V1I6]|nr:hypothetical protein [Streptomyces sp. V1I6]
MLTACSAPASGPAGPRSSEPRRQRRPLPYQPLTDAQAAPDRAVAQGARDERGVGGPGAG